ncbi:hypothetical protein LJ655_21655 [Paraburkholderia sp. MMS20-SJTN17]|uniref:Uncharacterized protein n=1 Tax=Paraburkholderia translucens TaxID=2886945 RepID=A0ABS8KI57_9BURK|nr:hypothetical protein [Paraburkholderia sp. MMS20-SJTN17]MCC8404454.1 hypothetical protein [Paraburkholderia sp. MMS20-SJTN17]
MDIWLGLLAAPAAVLATQSIDYALIRLACASGAEWPMHAVSAAAFLFCAFAAWLAYGRWRAECSIGAPAYTRRIARTGFFALMAMIVGALSALIQLAMWFPQWLLPACR